MFRELSLESHILQIYTLLELKFFKYYFKLRMNEMFRFFVRMTES
jgi:hypothetical protein